MNTVDTETGEIIQESVTIRAAGRAVTATPEQLRLVGEGMGRFDAVEGRTVLREAQPLGEIHENVEIVVDLLRFGHRLAITIDAPNRLTVHEAEILRGMLDRAIKAGKKIAEKL